MTQYSCVRASSAVFDEIEKAVLPVEEVQIENPVPKEITETHPAEAEEHSDNKEETPDVKEEQNTAENEEQTAPVKEQTVTSKKVTEKEEPAENKNAVTKPKTKEIPVKTVQTKEKNTVEPVIEKSRENTKKSIIRFSSLKTIYNECVILLAGISDRMIIWKETVLNTLFPGRFDYPLCYKSKPEIKKFTDNKAVLPYYFIFPEPVKKHLEDTAFKTRITDISDLFPYGYTIKYFGDKIEAPEKAVTSQGTIDYRVLINAPSPKIEVLGEPLFVKLIIDIRNNTLYKYDQDGFPLKAYLVATGARGSRTRAGLRIVSYTDIFPFRGAPNSKRAVDPYSYGPFIFFLNSVNMKTGKQYAVDQLLHGNGNENSIGRKVSHGCVRTNNKVMRNELSKEVKRGDYILLINPDIN